MSHQVTIPTTQLNRLADLLEQASQVVRGLAAKNPKTFHPIIPHLQKPSVLLKDEEWFWSDEWQAGERAVNSDLKAGQYKIFETTEELLADLHHQV